MNRKKLSCISAIVLLLLSFSALFSTASAVWVATYTIQSDTGQAFSASYVDGEDLDIKIELDVGALGTSTANNSIAYVSMTGSGYNQLEVWVYSDGVQVNAYTNYRTGRMLTGEFLNATIAVSDTIELSYAYGGEIALFVNEAQVESMTVLGGVKTYSNALIALVGTVSGEATFTLANVEGLEPEMPITYTVALVVNVTEGSSICNGTFVSSTILEGIGTVYTYAINQSDVVAIEATANTNYAFNKFVISGATTWGEFLTNPTYLTVESSLTATVDFYSTIITLPPTLTWNFADFTFTLTALAELVLAAFLTLGGIMILIRASGSWFIGLILIVAGFFLSLLAMPNIFGLLGFALEVIMSAVLSYRVIRAPSVDK